MIVDASAIVAIVLDAPHSEQLAELVLDATAPKMSAATAVEVSAVLTRRLRPEDQRRVERLLDVWEVELVPFDAEQAAIACTAYRDFGRGSGHPAALNLGDCYSYALADVTGEPLLFAGDDFVHTDVTAAYPG
ncbi:type II toxin-antitoxin system VapC family toxin [Mycobacterium lacus]|uniref:Ribonuclease VapC n=1 Tax=Mycobacterium lacus TaxID=169765 RepID=A0A1X1YRA1_9MYCO|nr:type II toxin-antitoxin system VapC family toxin [Mycobacterium lacus]MCV7122728.1 type II toxin-antitoxin system VapC family toxin [Mycobacterium lacus]ORW13575.1 ribonuclease [Mycobacterium lacus]BBX98267.1 ribonuclease VapC42 [Mycobacterium lacus]